MKQKESNFMDGRIEKLLKRMHFEPGKKVFVFIDTGAIIDAEAEFAKWRCYESSAKIEKIYNSLLDKGLNLFVTAPVFGEVSKHHNYHKINGQAEISKQNFDIVNYLHIAYERFLQNAQPTEKANDKLRLDVYWASASAFEEDEKKRVRDPMSYVDRDFISSAVLAKYSNAPFNFRKADGTVETVVQTPDEVILLSPDSHVHKTINVLLNDKDHFNYDGIRTVSSR